jgi:hypothetical protein
MNPVKANSDFLIKPVLKRWNFSNLFFNAFDVVLIVTAFQCSYLINFLPRGGYFFSERYLVSLLVSILPFWILILYLIKFTQIPTKRHQILLIVYLHSALLVLSLLILLCFIFNLFPVPLKLLIELSFLGFLFLFIGRILEYQVFKNYSAKRHIHRKIVIIADDSSIFFIENLLSKKELGYKVVAIFTQSAIVKEKYENRVIILPEKYLGILSDMIEIDLIDEVLFLKGKIDPEEVRVTVTTCEELGVTFRLRYSDSKLSLSSAIRTSFANGNFLSFINVPYHSFALAIRKSMDINMSLLMIVVLSPVFVIIGALIKFSSYGPIICNHEGVGWKGRPVMLYRFRTYIENSDLKSFDPQFNRGNNIQSSLNKENTRISKIGSFLISSGLDQLPQLFNVLRGEMPILALQPSL